MQYNQIAPNLQIEKRCTVHDARLKENRESCIVRLESENKKDRT
jgi:hypothetical protein